MADFFYQDKKKIWLVTLAMVNLIIHAMRTLFSNRQECVVDCVRIILSVEELIIILSVEELKGIFMYTIQQIGSVHNIY